MTNFQLFTYHVMQKYSNHEDNQFYQEQLQHKYEEY